MQMRKRMVACAALIVIVAIGLVSAAILYSKHYDFGFKVKKGMGLELWNESKTTRVDNIIWSDFDPLQTQTQTFYVKNIGNNEANVTATLGSYDTTAWSISLTWVDETVAKKAFSTGTLVLSITEIDAVGDLAYSCDLTLDIVDHFSEPVTLSFGTTTATYEAATATYLVLQASGTDQATYSLGEAGTFWYETKNIKTSEILVAWQDSIEILKDGSLYATVQGATTHTVNLAPLGVANLSVPFVTPAVDGNYAFRVVYHLADSVPLNPENYLEIAWAAMPDMTFKRVDTVIASGYEYSFPELNIGEQYTSDNMWMVNDGTLASPRDITFVVVGLPTGYSLELFADGVLWEIYAHVYMNYPKPWTFVIHNNSGSVNADFSTFELYLYY